MEFGALEGCSNRLCFTPKYLIRRKNALAYFVPMTKSNTLSEMLFKNEEHLSEFN